MHQTDAMTDTDKSIYQLTLETIKKECKPLSEIFGEDCQPQLLQKCMTAYNANVDKLDEHARDILYLASLTALSICFPRVRLPYGGNGVQSLNFSLLFGAPSSSNKSMMKFAIKILEKIDEFIEASYKEDLREWRHQCERWEQEKKLAAKEKRQINFDLEPGDRPVIARLVIPLNSSKSMWIDLMKGNEQYGNFAYSSELDSFNDANGKDYGNMTDVFNKAATNEMVDKGFRVDGKLVKVSFPMLSLLASGTLDQLHRTVSSYENGLGSRLPIYLSPDQERFICQKPSKENVNFERIYSDLADEVLRMWKFFVAFYFTVVFTDDQWERHTRGWEELFNDVHLSRREMVSVSLRFGLLHMRIASVFTMLRLWDKVKVDEDAYRRLYVMGNEHPIECSDEDFEMAGHIATTLFEHTMIFSTSKVQAINAGIKAMELWRWQYDVLKQMPDTFTVQQFAEHAKKACGKSTSHCYKVLKQMSTGKTRLIRKLKTHVDGRLVYKKVTGDEK